jgi:aryl-alcohol dehydrogenase-like predicted oxidoreductase
MISRMLGKTGFSVSEIGFGAWGLGGTMWGPVSDIEAQSVLKTAFEQGITFVDTALAYGDGVSERRVGRAVRQFGRPIIVATKIPPMNWMWPAPAGVPLAQVYPDHWIEQCVGESLQNLGTGTIDLVQLHVYDPGWMDDPAFLKPLERLKAAGKIRHLGVSINDHQPDSALALVRSGRIDTVQVIFNLFDQSPLESLFPACHEHNVGVIVRVPLDEGGLSGTLTENTRFEKGDFRSRYFRGNRLTDTVRRAKSLEEIAREDGMTLPEMAVRFCLDPGAVSTVILGMRKPSHAVRNAGYSGKPKLSAKLLNTLSRHAWDQTAPY